MDPLSILAVAAAVVQFVDYGSRLLNKSVTIYRSLRGDETKIAKLGSISAELEHLLNSIDDKIRLLDSSHSPLRPSDISVLRHCKRSRSICQEVLGIVVQIKGSGIEEVDFTPVKQHGIEEEEFTPLEKNMKLELPEVKMPEFLKRKGNGEPSKKGGLESFRAAASKILGKHIISAEGSGNSWGEVRLDKLAADLKETKNDLMLAMIASLWEDSMSAEVGKGQQRQEGLRLQRQIESETIDDVPKHDEVLTAVFNRQSISDNTTGPSQPLHTGKVDDRESRWVEMSDDACVTVILKLLDDPALSHREINIPEAHRKTFEWIFEKPRVSTTDDNTLTNMNTAEGPSEPVPLWSDFSEWLRSDSKSMYWITGKPGSGKSTLMKLITHHSKTRQLLQEWSSGLPVLTAAFYSWNPGTDFQKTLDGLLRTLLHQVISHYPSLAPELFPSRWAMLRLFGDIDQLQNSLPPWSSEELQNSMLLLQKLLATKSHIAIFIDGLDEFSESNGGHDHLLALLRRLHDELPCAKLCVSSRPWNAFRDAFAHCPQLRMELLTQADITTFVQSTMDSVAAFKELKQHAPTEAESLLSTVVEKAEGVFLWVAVVTKALVIGLSEGDMLDELRSLLDDIPSDLMDLYTRLWERISDDRRQQGAMLVLLFETFRDEAIHIQLSVDSRGKIHVYERFPPLMTPQMLWIADGGSPDQTETHIVSTLTRRLDSRTRGLLTIKRHNQGTYVAYLHRTGADWIHSRLETIKSKDAPEDFDPHLSLLRWRVSDINLDSTTLIERLRERGSASRRTTPVLLNHHIFAESCHQVAQCLYHAVRVQDKPSNYKKIVDAVDRIEKPVQAYINSIGPNGPLGSVPFWTSEHTNSSYTDFMAMCARAGATVYIRAKFQTLKKTGWESSDTITYLGETVVKRGENEWDCYYHILANLALGSGQLMSTEQLKTAKQAQGKEGARVLETLLGHLGLQLGGGDPVAMSSPRYQALVALLPVLMAPGVHVQGKEQQREQKMMRKRLRDVCTELITRKQKYPAAEIETARHPASRGIARKAEYADAVVDLLREYGVSPSLKSRLKSMIGASEI